MHVNARNGDPNEARRAGDKWREKKKKKLEAECSAVMHEINDKRKALASLANNIQDMELT